MGDEEVGKLQIHVRRVMSNDGAIESENEVYCAPRDRSIPVADCEVCAHYAGSAVDLEAGRNFVLCRRLTPESARSLRAARHAWVGHRHAVDAASPGERTRVSEIMTTDVFCVRESLPLAEVKQLLLSHGIGGVPVVNPAGEPVGVVSEHDLISHRDGETVAGAMTRLTFVLPETATISQAAALMAFEGIHRLPIVSDDGKVIGIVSSLDLLKWLARVDGYLMPERR